MLLKHKIAEIQIKYDDQYHLWTAEILTYPHTWILVHDAERDEKKMNKTKTFSCTIYTFVFAMWEIKWDT